MQRSIASFFKPKSKEKDVKKISDEPVKEPVKSPLKVQNGVQEADSPVKKVVKRSRQILDSDDDEAPVVKEQVTPKGQADKAGLLRKEKDNEIKAVPTQLSPPPVPVIPTTSTTPGTPDTATSVSPYGIPKRKTARKMFLKRKLNEDRSGEESQEEEEKKVPEAKESCEQQSKRPRVESPAGSKTGNNSEPMEEGAKEGVEKAVIESNGAEEKKRQDEGKEEEMTENNSEQKGTKDHELKEKDEKDEEKGPVVAKEVEVEKDAGEGKGSLTSHTANEQKEAKEQRDKDSTKKAPISSFFAPRKATAKMEKPKDKNEGEKKRSAEKRQTEERSAVEESKVKKGMKSDYDPSRPNYHPVDHACWGLGQKVPYLALARTFERIEEDSGRLKNIETLSNLLRSVLVLSPDDLLCCVYLCLNQLGPAYLGMELGVGETVLMKAVAQATGRQLDKIKAEAQEKGDLGLVAESSRSNQRMMFQPANLTAGGVFRKLKEIANMGGNSAMNKKIDIIKGLFVACRFSEARYIVRSLAGKLRIGLAEQSVLAALNQAVCLTPPGQDFPPTVIDAGKGMSAESKKAWIEEKSLILKQTYCEMPNYDIIIPVLLKEGIDQLPNHCKLTPGVPLRPMLAQPTKGVGEVLKRFDEAAFTCEYKYDGERAQIHILESGEVRIFSRNQEDNTSKYPDIISRIPKVKKGSVTSCVLDSEAVAWDREKGQIQPFQVLTTRKRKDVDASEIKVQVCVYAFDLLYLNGESLVRQPLSRRRALLKENFSEVEGEFVFARSIDSNSTENIAEFLEQSVRDSCEGLMVKTLEKDATYEIAKRSHNWLKLKKDYLDGVGDTVDLCVIGAYLGKGKRTGTYGGFLLACYDDDNEEFQSVCKIGTGFKDEDLEQHYKFLKEHILPNPRAYYRVDQSAEPDVWLDAMQVWEVKCADLSLSPIYKAAMGLVDPEKGISLRFPRFLRIRDDKKPEEATTGAQMADFYKKQQQIQNQGEKAELEDYY
ncbi:DNA ligase 1 [Lampris incognitus]|uniref:DNA ligase 1 n=1 Tax=Lampris incognitus TaxID=2546036 RepID=UPI0024B578D5|nr:DNA ligase 1 [Lampris incognitus]